MSEREKVRVEEFYDLRRKLWVETMAATASRWSPTDAARLADSAVAEFDKRFKAVC